jgi:hypothetical protein
MNISKADLVQILKHLVNDIESSGNEQFTLQYDYYWSIPTDSLYQVQNDPQDLTIGNLHDEWNWLMEVAKGKRPLGTVELKWISALLRYMTDKAILR